MNILVINAGSSSLKYQLFDMNTGEVTAKGLCERIGTSGCVTHKVPGREPYKEQAPIADHYRAVQKAVELLLDPQHGVISSLEQIDAIGHRVAHGGERYRSSTRAEEGMLEYLKSIIPINPLHGPPAIAGMEACLRLFGNIPQAAVFDTAFYADFTPDTYVYALPYEYYSEHGIRKFGFHGTSHRYVTALAAQVCGCDVERMKIITCHLGNGSSITAVDGGRAIDTTMGFTPQDGVPMGTRSGALDPTVLPYIMKLEKLDADACEELINKKSGLLGVSGVSGDIRDVEEKAFSGESERCKLALEILYTAVKKQIGAFAARLNGLDCLVFTAGIGEHDPELREAVCADMDFFGIAIDNEKNYGAQRGCITDITAQCSRVRVLVLPTDEEKMIALDTQKLCGGGEKQ